MMQWIWSYSNFCEYVQNLVKYPKASFFCENSQGLDAVNDFSKILLLAVWIGSGYASGISQRDNFHGFQKISTTYLEIVTVESIKDNPEVSKFNWQLFQQKKKNFKCSRHVTTKFTNGENMQKKQKTEVHLLKRL